MVRIFEKFDNKANANIWRDRYLNLYHPAGYGTYLKEPYQNSEGKWVVEGTRGSSAD